ECPRGRGRKRGPPPRGALAVSPGTSDLRRERAWSSDCRCRHPSHGARPADKPRRDRRGPPIPRGTSPSLDRLWFWHECSRRSSLFETGPRRLTSPCPAGNGNETGCCIPASWRSEFSPDEKMIDRDRAAAVHQEIQRGHGPHQRVFEARFVPEISADPPALVIGYDEKDHDRAGGEARKQPEREHRAAEQLRDGDRRRPEFSGTIAVAVEL